MLDQINSEAASKANAFAIVAVGASAGGLEAFTQLLRSLPNDTGMAFVLIQHLDPEHQRSTEPF
jgi:two-component system CheB/CheR fusion protein